MSARAVVRRVLIIINKDWEADAVLAALTSPKARPPQLTNPVLFEPHFPPDGRASPGTQRPIVRPRAIFDLTSTGALIAEIWCLQDAMDPHLVSSSSTEKAKALASILAFGTHPVFAVAVGTAAFPGPDPVAGSVAIGSDVFVHDPYPGSGIPGSDGWFDPHLEQLLVSPASGSKVLLPFVRDASSRTGLRAAVESRLLIPPLASANPRIVRPSSNAVSVSVVNVNTPDHYVWTDPSGIDAFHRLVRGRPVGSLETTHGVIRIVCCDQTPFLFVSGFANRVGYFDTEVAPREYTQNFAAAHNAGVATAWVLPLIADFLSASL